MSGESPDVEEEAPLLPRPSDADPGFRWCEPGRLTGSDKGPHVTDEVFNAASHLCGAMTALLGTAVLIAGAAEDDSPWAVVSFSIYGFTLMLVFLASFAMHGMDCGEQVNRVLRLIDYLAIYLLIAGTATPICLCCLHSSFYGWVFFGVLWLLATFGTVLQLVGAPPQWATLTIFVTMGWFGALLAIPAYPCLEFGGLLLLSLGGVSYTGGAVIFALQKPNPVPGTFAFHEIWHICVLVGAGLHWMMMFFYLMPNRTTA
eukprot:TRINITY_DN319_c0_g4_i1.p2 TRINITY_DN319_c0_g4~~TRINITY_DN319_c0_g4_i1.p2  ORF type:complete len:259 (+),score=82.96 TRINITY_DN319_c0_g4_i1:101-877(+)